MTRPPKRLTLGALTAIVIGIVTALAVAAGAYGQDRPTVERAGELRGHLDAVGAPVTRIHREGAIMDPEHVAQRYRAQPQRLQRFGMRPLADPRHFVRLDQPEGFDEDLARVIEEVR